MALTNIKYAGILLAGGQSSRYGSPKAFAKHQDEFFYERALQMVSPFIEDFVIVSHPTLTEKFKMKYGHQVIEDVMPFRGDGPLAGIYSGMNAIIADAYIVLPCDMPFLEPETIAWLIREYEQAVDMDGIIPEVKRRVQPLVTILRPSALPEIETLLMKKERRMMGLLEKLAIKIVDASHLPNADVQFRNINTPNEYFQE